MSAVQDVLPPWGLRGEGSEHWIQAAPYPAKRWKWISGNWQPGIGGPITPHLAALHGYRYLGLAVPGDDLEMSTSVEETQIAGDFEVTVSNDGGPRIVRIPRFAGVPLALEDPEGRLLMVTPMRNGGYTLVPVDPTHPIDELSSALDAFDAMERDAVKVFGQKRILLATALLVLCAIGAVLALRRTW